MVDNGWQWLIMADNDGNNGGNTGGNNGGKTG